VPVDQQLFGRHGELPLLVVAEAIGSGSSTSKLSTSVCSWVASVRPGVNGTSTL
jgi:hypothetical protein